MVNQLPEINPAGIYTATKTAKILGISRVSLYKYDKQGSIKHCIDKNTGYRKYKGIHIIAYFNKRFS